MTDHEIENIPPAEQPQSRRDISQKPLASLKNTDLCQSKQMEDKLKPSLKGNNNIPSSKSVHFTDQFAEIVLVDQNEPNSQYCETEDNKKSNRLSKELNIDLEELSIGSQFVLSQRVMNDSDESCGSIKEYSNKLAESVSNRIIDCVEDEIIAEKDELKGDVLKQEERMASNEEVNAVVEQHIIVLQESTPQQIEQEVGVLMVPLTNEQNAPIDNLEAIILPSATGEQMQSEQMQIDEGNVIPEMNQTVTPVGQMSVDVANQGITKVESATQMVRVEMVTRMDVGDNMAMKEQNQLGQIVINILPASSEVQIEKQEKEKKEEKNEGRDARIECRDLPLQTDTDEVEHSSSPHQQSQTDIGQKEEKDEQELLQSDSQDQEQPQASNQSDDNFQVDEEEQHNVSLNLSTGASPDQSDKEAEEQQDKEEYEDGQEEYEDGQEEDEQEYEDGQEYEDQQEMEQVIHLETIRQFTNESARTLSHEADPLRSDRSRGSICQNKVVPPSEVHSLSSVPQKIAQQKYIQIEESTYSNQQDKDRQSDQQVAEEKDECEEQQCQGQQYEGKQISPKFKGIILYKLYQRLQRVRDIQQSKEQLLRDCISSWRQINYELALSDMKAKEEEEKEALKLAQQKQEEEIARAEEELLKQKRRLEEQVELQAQKARLTAQREEERIKQEELAIKAEEERKMRKEEKKKRKQLQQQQKLRVQNEKEIAEAEAQKRKEQEIIDALTAKEVELFCSVVIKEIMDEIISELETKKQQQEEAKKKKQEEAKARKRDEEAKERKERMEEARRLLHSMKNQFGTQKKTDKKVKLEFVKGGWELEPEEIIRMDRIDNKISKLERRMGKLFRGIRQLPGMTV